MYGDMVNGRRESNVVPFPRKERERGYFTRAEAAVGLLIFGLLAAFWIGTIVVLELAHEAVKKALS